MAGAVFGRAVASGAAQEVPRNRPPADMSGDRKSVQPVAPNRREIHAQPGRVNCLRVEGDRPARRRGILRVVSVEPHDQERIITCAALPLPHAAPLCVPEEGGWHYDASELCTNWRRHPSR
jgi:hypothetical protein